MSILWEKKSFFFDQINELKTTLFYSGEEYGEEEQYDDDEEIEGNDSSHHR